MRAGTHPFLYRVTRCICVTRLYRFVAALSGALLRRRPHRRVVIIRSTKGSTQRKRRGFMYLRCRTITRSFSLQITMTHSAVFVYLETWPRHSCPVFRSRSNRFKRGINCPTDYDMPCWARIVLNCFTVKAQVHCNEICIGDDSAGNDIVFTVVLESTCISFFDMISHILICLYRI